MQCIVKGQLAALVLEGRIGMLVDDRGQVQYTGSKSGRA